MLGGWEILDKPEKVKVKKEKKKLKNGERMLDGWEILDKTEKRAGKYKTNPEKGSE